MELELERLRGKLREGDHVDSAAGGRRELERRSSELKKDSELQEVSSESWQKDVELQNKEPELQSIIETWRRRADALRRRRRHWF